MKTSLPILITMLLLVSAVASNAQNKYQIRSLKTVKPIGPIADSTSQPYNISIELDHHYPYCGGAYPDESEMYNYQILANATFHLYNIETGEKSNVKTDSTGTLKLNLPPGKYGLREMYKDCTFSEFCARYQTTAGDYYERADSSCYENWWKSNFIEFTVTSPTFLQTFSYTFSDHCFTGNNPCISYMGPWPP